MTTLKAKVSGFNKVLGLLPDDEEQKTQEFFLYSSP